MMESRPTPFGEWLNRDGYTLTKCEDLPWAHYWSVSVYDFCPIRVHPVTGQRMMPLTFREVDGTEIRIQRMMTDDGSIPPMLQNLPGLSSNRFEYSYLFHDFECKYGGVFVRGATETEFHFRRTTRLDADCRLRRGVGANFGNAVVRATIYRGVRLGAQWQKFPSIRYWDEEPPKPITGSLPPLGAGILRPA